MVSRWTNAPTARRAVLLALGITLAAGAPPAEAKSCSVPAQAHDWTQVSPASVDLDASQLAQGLQMLAGDGNYTTAVYRHGCLAATFDAGSAVRDRSYEAWSMSKSVVSLAAGRAMTLGLLSPDDPVGALLPEADKAHGAVTVQELLEMTSGVHWNFFRDYLGGPEQDKVGDWLTLPFDHEPGTYFEYAQTAISTLAEVISRAAGEDFQAFLDRELLSKVGIPRSAWTWSRESHGHTLGFMGFDIKPQDFARLAWLMLHHGRFDGRQLLSPAYVERATSPDEHNPGYGWLWWVNAGDSFIGPTTEGRAAYARPLVASVPRDAYSGLGFQGQILMVIPSLDMIITRHGSPGTPSGDGPAFATFGQQEYEALRVLMRAVQDRHVPDPGPFPQDGPTVAPDPNYGIRHSATELADRAAQQHTPALPAKGPARARAVVVAGAGMHDSPLRLELRDGRLVVPISCPPVAHVSCRGTASIGASKGSYRMPHGGHALLRLKRPKGASTATLRLVSRAQGGSTVVRVPVRWGDR
jgi:CubicO group peptidase (beta-lactamase class C family)